MLSELRRLRAKERLPLVREENTVLDGRYLVPTFDEVLALARSASRASGRTIAVAPETKHPTCFDSTGLSLEEPLLRSLRRAGLTKAKSLVHVQSFEEADLRDLRPRGGGRPVQLTSAGPTARPYDHVVAGDPTTYAQMTTPDGLYEIAEYTDVFSPDKAQVLPRAADGTTGLPTALVHDAHAAGLAVVPCTVRAENQVLPVQYRRGTDPNAYGDVLSELEDRCRAGVDGVLADQPDLARMAHDGS